MGALFTQQIATASWDGFVAWLRSGDGELIGTSLHTDRDYQQPLYRRPAFILVGNEAQGLPPTYEAECDTLVKIPMLGKADSLNAAVATAVMAYEVLNQSRKSHLGT
jgi:RNA methyltransferase, TrmH family